MNPHCTCDEYREVDEQVDCPIHDPAPDENPWSGSKLEDYDGCTFCGKGGHTSKTCPVRPIEDWLR